MTTVSLRTVVLACAVTAMVTGVLMVLLLPLAANARENASSSSTGCDVRGTRADERIAGGWVAEKLCGLGGDDLISGGTGNDHVLGGSGDDRLRGDSGDDRLDGGPGNDEVGLPNEFMAERGDDVLIGRDGNDRLTAGQGDDRADGGPGDDVIEMGFGDDEIALGGPGIDRVHGGNGNDGTRVPDGGLFGGPDADLITGGPGDDRLVGDGGEEGMPGDDVLFGGGGADGIDGGDGNDFITGGKGGDELDGGPGHDVLVGNSAADVLRGGDGDDLLWATDFESNSTEVLDQHMPAAPGDNLIDCGDGNDLAVIDLADDRNNVVNCEHVIVLRSDRSSCQAVAQWFSGGVIKSTHGTSEPQPPSANRVLQTASPFAEKPALPADAEALRHCGAYAAAYLLDPTDDRRPNLRGTDGPDVLDPIIGEAEARSANVDEEPAPPAPAASPDGATIFYGKEGDDVITGSPGADTMMGGTGDDVLRGLDGDDGSLEGEDGHDRIYGGNGNDVLFGRTGNDLLWGEDGDDYLEGGRGTDGLSGGAGDDILFGGFDRDRLKGGAGNDTIYAYDGVRDIVDCGPGNDVAEVDRYDVVRGCERVISPKTKRAKASRRLR